MTREISKDLSKTVKTDYWLYAEDINIIMQAYAAEARFIEYSVDRVDTDDVLIAPAINSVSALIRRGIDTPITRAEQFTFFFGSRSNIKARIQTITSGLTGAEMKTLRCNTDENYARLRLEIDALAALNTIEALNKAKKYLTAKIKNRLSGDNLDALINIDDQYALKYRSEDEKEGFRENWQKDFNNNFDKILKLEAEQDQIPDSESRLGISLDRVDKLQDEKFRVCFPYQVDNSHWNSLVFDISKDDQKYKFEVRQIDPYGGKRSFDKDMRASLESVLSNGLAHYRPDSEAEISYLDIAAPKLQSDGSSCGFIAAKTISMLAPKQNRDKDFTTICIGDQSRGYADKIQTHGRVTQPYERGAKDLRLAQLKMVEDQKVKCEYYEGEAIFYNRFLKAAYNETNQSKISNAKADPSGLRKAASIASPREKVQKLSDTKPEGYFQNTDLYGISKEVKDDVSTKLRITKTEEKYSIKAIQDKITQNIQSAIDKCAEDDKLFLQEHLGQILHFARIYNGVGNAGLASWQQHFGSRGSTQLADESYFNIAKEFSFKYQQIAKTAGFYTGREDGDEGKKLKITDEKGNKIEVGHRLKRIPAEMAQGISDQIKSNLDESIAR
ncbi:MAG: hypothetical protein HOM96_02650 [Rickettsiales bacterium]|nr:hypothetical protein [Rickettsiales bacterium]